MCTDGMPHIPPAVLPPACATVAEVRKRGDEFWSEFEFYLSDLLVRWEEGMMQGHCSQTAE